MELIPTEKSWKLVQATFTDTRRMFLFFSTDFPHLPALADVDNDLG